MSESEGFTYEKVKELLALPEDQREVVLDRVFIRYIDELTANISKQHVIHPQYLDSLSVFMANVEPLLRKMKMDPNSLRTIIYLKNLLQEEIWNIMWILTFAAKPEHRIRLSNLWAGLSQLIPQPPKETK